MTEVDPERVTELRDQATHDPGGTVERMRAGDRDLIAEYVTADAVPYIKSWFTESGDGWRIDPERTGPLGRGSIGVEWSFEGVHDRDGAFNGLAASNRDVVLRGFSIIGVEDGAFKIRRYVDWAGLFSQLHLSLSWRVPVGRD